MRWKIPLAKMWYRHFHTDVGATIQTIENILRTQWYLEKNNIKYFMTTYMDIFGFMVNHGKDADVKYLLDMVNFDTFLDVNGCYEWVRDNCDHTHAFPDSGADDKMGNHPTEHGHQKFTEQIITPHIKKYVNN